MLFCEGSIGIVLLKFSYFPLSFINVNLFGSFTVVYFVVSFNVIYFGLSLLLSFKLNSLIIPALILFLMLLIFFVIDISLLSLYGLYLIEKLFKEDKHFGSYNFCSFEFIRISLPTISLFVE